MIRGALRWTVPAGIGAAVIAATLVAPSVAAAGTSLPERTPQQLLTDLQGATASAVQGTVRVEADLGLPSLPSMAQAGGGPGHDPADLTSVLSGTTTMRVWASQDGARVAVQGTLGETDVVTDGTQGWIWSSSDQTVTHLTAPDEAAMGGHDATGPGQWAGTDPRAALASLTPEQLSQAVLAALDPSTSVTSGPDTTVAGRPAYQLVLTPKDAGTLVGSVTVAIDAAERVPTKVTVTSTVTGQPALTAGFTDVSFTAPDPSMFAFTPPAGATVQEKTPGEDDATGTTGGAPAGDSPTPQVVGKGWASVLVMSGVPSLDTVGTSGASEGADDMTALLGALPQVSGSWGSGRLLTSHLVSALLTDDGRLLVGAVDATTLEAAAAATR
jgi:outer membrane lipoprotein-sorting protein